MDFHLQSPYSPTGDQPAAIKQLVQNLAAQKQFQTLLGVTGSGKTFTMANVIQEMQRPTLVLAHNKTLAAQLAAEFREFFPQNAVHYFVSYYDYYQPEAYIAQSDTYIEKDAAINEEIDKFRHAATTSLLTRRDVIIVASVSCIYGIGDKDSYLEFACELNKGQSYKRDTLLKELAKMQYQRAHMDFKQGMFQTLGDILEIFPPNMDTIYRLDFFDDELEAIYEADPITGEVKDELEKIIIFPAKHFVTPHDTIIKVAEEIRQEMNEQVAYFKNQGKLLEAERIRMRTEYDLEMLVELGYTNGIENYSRFLSGRQPGEPPSTLIDYFPEDFLMFVDESHISIPQVRGMHNGDRARKQSLIEYGFRLPSALDNRPLRFEEFEQKFHQVVFVSATPAAYELDKSEHHVVEQIIRPTGLLDPSVEVKPSRGQIDEALYHIKERSAKGERVLITTLTKKTAEDLTDFFTEHNIKVRYLHSEIDTLERLEILRDLREGKFDVLVGINLLREGLDLPEVSLILIFDADKQGFLRSESSLIQTIGRAARNSNGHVIMFADRVTDAMEKAISETKRRRAVQEEYNQEHDITPTTIFSKIKSIGMTGKKSAKKEKLSRREALKKVTKLELEMDLLAANLEFEKAAELRDQILALRKSLSEGK